MCHRPGNSVYDVYREVGAVGSYDIEDITTYLRFTDETGSRAIDFTWDLERLERDLLEISPRDAGEIRALIKEAAWMRDSPLLTDLGMSVKPPELRTPLDSVKEMWQMRGFIKYFRGKYSKSAAEYSEGLRDPFLRAAFRNLFSPEAPVWFIIMILAVLANRQLGLFKEGCHEFVEAIAEKYRALGGTIRYRARVTKVLVEDHKAVGVLLEDGTEHRADVVVSASDGRSTIYQLLGGEYVDERTENRYRTWKPYDPLVAVSLGVTRVFEGEPPMAMFLMGKPLKYGGRSTSCLPLRVFNYGEAYAPEGKTVVQVMLETGWDYWFNLRQDREAYVAEKERLARDIIDRLEAPYPGISSQVEMIDVATPVTSWRYTLNDRGSPMGWMLTKETLMEQIPRTLPGLDSFYMAGHWVLPGGGVPSTIYTGRNVVQILCKKDGKQFKTS